MLQIKALEYTIAAFLSYVLKDVIKIIYKEIEGGISLIEVLNNSNIMVFVGGGSNPQFPLNRLIVWDDYQMKILSEIKVITNIRNVKVKKELYVDLK